MLHAGYVCISIMYWNLTRLQDLKHAFIFLHGIQTGAWCIVSSEGLLWWIESAKHFVSGEVAYGRHVMPSTKWSPNHVVTTFSHAWPQLWKMDTLAVHHNLPISWTLPRISAHLLALSFTPVSHTHIQFHSHNKNICFPVWIQVHRTSALGFSFSFLFTFDGLKCLDQGGALMW